jgi:hypothetical protein
MLTKVDKGKMKRAAVRGARALDMIYPRWWEQVKLGTLDLASASHCVVGQVACAHFKDLSGDTPGDVVDQQLLVRMVRAAGRPYRQGLDLDADNDQAAYVGYVPHSGILAYDARHGAYAVLQAAWAEEIRARRRRYRARLAARNPRTRRPAR